jgi:peptide-methionine (S)-S-oxide reductase
MVAGAVAGASMLCVKVFLQRRPALDGVGPGAHAAIGTVRRGAAAVQWPFATVPSSGETEMRSLHSIAPALLVAGLLGWTGVHAGPGTVPPPRLDRPAPSGAREQVAYLAGGCYWGVESVFEHVRGVRAATSGNAAGGVETVKLAFDPAVVSYGRLLQIFFAVAHDPTQRGRQGPDIGAQYRSEILTVDAAQQRIASDYVAQLEMARVFPAPITTRVAPVRGFRPASEDQQDYARRHPRDGYIVRNDAPKVAQLKALFPGDYRDD